MVRPQIPKLEGISSYQKSLWLLLFRLCSSVSDATPGSLVFDSSSGNVNISTGEAWSASNLLAATETVRGIVFSVINTNIGETTSLGERPYEIDGRTDHGVISEEVPEIFATFDERGDRNGANVLLFAVAILSEIQKLQEQVKTLRKQRGL